MLCAFLAFHALIGSHQFLFTASHAQRRGKVIKLRQGDDSGVKPMFVALVLDPIWQLYNAAITEQDPTKTVRMAAA